jgi:hypothetical protein
MGNLAGVDLDPETEVNVTEHGVVLRTVEKRGKVEDLVPDQVRPPLDSHGNVNLTRVDDPPHLTARQGTARLLLAPQGFRIF